MQTIPHPVTGTPCKFVPIPTTRRFKLTKSQRKQLRREELEAKAHNVPNSRSKVCERGAAKIFGLVGSHIYATKPE